MVIVVNCITQTTPYTLKRYSSSFLFWNYTEWIRIVWVFGGTFINVLLISWQSTLMVGEIGIPAENHRSFIRNWLHLQWFVTFGGFTMFVKGGVVMVIVWFFDFRTMIAYHYWSCDFVFRIWCCVFGASD